MRNFHALLDTVQRNCHITDARHARSMTMCIYLLEMQQYYRWENEIPYSASLAKSDVGKWLAERENFWSEVETLPYAHLPLGEAVDPFDSESVNRLIVPEGFVYSAGYGRFGKPHFFLGKLLKKERRGKYTVLVSSCEYARDLNAPPAAYLNGTIFLRKEAVRRMVWERRGKDMEEAVEAQCEAIILHELGEGMAGEELGGWEAMLLASSGKTEIVFRAVRDLLADCLSTLPSLIAKNDDESLRFYFESLSGMRRDLFPKAVEAYQKWLASGEMDALRDAAEQGSVHWLQVGRGFLERYGREGEIQLESWSEFRL